MYKYEDKDWLSFQYINQKKTIEQIAKICNVSDGTIHKRLVKFDIPRRKLIGKGNPNWKGGVSRYNEDYKKKIGKITGRVLKCDEIVHHIDNDGRNNQISNLFICKDYKHHAKLHKQIVNLSFKLVKLGIIKFNQQEGKYYISFDKIRSSEIMDLNIKLKK